MTKLNVYAGLGIAIYLIAVVYHGNSQKLLGLIAAQKDFAKWAIALIILMYVADESNSATAKSFVTLALVAMALNAAGTGGITQAADQLTKIFEA